MKAGPTLKAWTVSPRRRNASSRPSVTVVLPTPLATPPTIRRRGDLIPGPPARTGQGVCARVGLLASGSSYSPRLPGSSPVAPASFVPGYSDGVAADSHRLPWALLGTLARATGGQYQSPSPLSTGRRAGRRDY